MTEGGGCGTPERERERERDDLAAVSVLAMPSDGVLSRLAPDRRVWWLRALYGSGQLWAFTGLDSGLSCRNGN
jgi:hypothetical protein